MSKITRISHLILY